MVTRGSPASTSSRFLGGEIVLDREGRVSILTDDNHWQEVVSLGRYDWGKVADAPRSGVAIFLGYHAAVIAPKRRGGYTAWTVGGDSHLGTIVSGGGYTSAASLNFFVSKLFGEAFYFGRSWFFFDFGNSRWLRVRPTGFAELEGSSHVVLSGSDILKNHPDSSVHDLEAIHRVLFQGHDGFYLYDGDSIVSVPNSGPDVVGEAPEFLDMPTLRRSLVKGWSGIFEVTPNGRLEKVASPRGVWGLSEWPEAHVGLAWADDALYSVSPRPRHSPGMPSQVPSRKRRLSSYSRPTARRATCSFQRPVGFS